MGRACRGGRGRGRRAVSSARREQWRGAEKRQGKGHRPAISAPLGRMGGAGRVEDQLFMRLLTGDFMRQPLLTDKPPVTGGESNHKKKELDHQC